MCSGVLLSKLLCKMRLRHKRDREQQSINSAPPIQQHKDQPLTRTHTTQTYLHTPHLPHTRPRISSLHFLRQCRCSRAILSPTTKSLHRAVQLRSNSPPGISPIGPATHRLQDSEVEMLGGRMARVFLYQVTRHLGHQGRGDVVLKI